MLKTIVARAVLAACALVVAPGALGQVVYEPVRVQFGTENRYFYGGDDPYIHALATSFANPAGTHGRVRGYRFVSATRVVERETPRIYSDLYGSENAADFGYTIEDAYNDAYARVPRHFRKADVLDSAVVGPGAVLIVPSTAPRPKLDGRPRPDIQRLPRQFRRGPVLVIPKSMLDRRVGDVAAPRHVVAD